MLELISKLKKTKDKNIYELIYNSGQGFLDITKIKEFNVNGYVYFGSQLDIDYEDEDIDGKTITKYMDIHYFSFIEPKEIHKDNLLEN